MNKNIDIFDLPVEIRKVNYKPAVHSKRQYSSSNERKKLTRELLLEILTDSGWNKAEVARRVGLSRASIWKYMKKWDIPMQRS